MSEQCPKCHAHFVNEYDLAGHRCVVDGFPVEKESDKSTLLSYLQLCIRDEDWHGVWDTASMLEVLDAKAKG